MIFSLAVDNDYCESNPCRKVKAFKVDNRRERFITHAEESRLLAALTGRNAHLRPVAIVALYTGMRRGEILRLEWRDVDLINDEIRIPKGTTKSGKGRVIPIDETVREALLSLRGERMESDRVFEGKGYYPVSVSEEFSKVCRSLGWHDVTLHTLRHTYATRLKDAGTDPFTIRDLLGHATLRMTDIYTHATPETMRRAVKLLEGRTSDVYEE